MKRYISSGVRSQQDTGDYVFDYTLNLPTDIIDVVPPQLYKSSIKNHIYWFGYQFKETASSKQRSDFIHYIKGLGETRISDHELTQFIELPLGVLDEKFNMYAIDCVVYPISNRSKLVNKIVSVVGSYTSRDKEIASYELVKNTPTEIEFDWKNFELDYGHDKNQYNQMKRYVEDVLLPAIRSLDYFSLAANVKPRYRKYIKNYLGFISQEQLESYARTQGSNILVIDDINTSGSTLDEILRILNAVNHNSNIFVFTLIGNFT